MICFAYSTNTAVWRKSPSNRPMALFNFWTRLPVLPHSATSKGLPSEAVKCVRPNRRPIPPPPPQTNSALRVDLEISKPQRNTRPTAADSGRARRSRSPDYSRGGSSPRRGSVRGGGGNSGPREVDRYRGPPPSDRELRDRRDRDDYGSRRRSPPLRARDDYRPGRRSRSRSPPPPRYRHRTRSRSPEPDDVPLPRRAPDQVPEVQILVSDELDRFVCHFHFSLPFTYPPPIC